MNAKNRSRGTVLILSLLALAALSALAGCAAPEMKGTPFYSGEYEKREGPPEDRIPMWPLLYYRDPALSVLWPIIELTEEHFAIRPVYSVYGTNKDEQVHNILWPIGQLDEQLHENRVFPFFWWGGSNPQNQYSVVFPLYWHRGEPYWGKRGHDALFPLWIYHRDGADYSTHFMWPIVRFERDGSERTWRLWPLFRNCQDGDDYDRFFMWPLGWAWADGDERGRCFVPLYWQNKSSDESAMFIFPVGWGGENDGASSWNAVFPLYFTGSDEDNRLLLTPLGGFDRSSDETKWFFLPLLADGEYRETDGEASWLLGLLKRKWSEGHSEKRVVPIYWYERNGNNKELFVLPLMSRGEWSSGYADIRLLLGLASVYQAGKVRQNHVLPFYFYKKDEGDNSRRFLSLPFSYGLNPDGSTWQAMPPFLYRDNRPDGSRLITPLWAEGSSENGKTKWHALIPFYLRRQTEDSALLVTALGGWKTEPEGTNWLIPPLLSGGSSDKGKGNVWVLAPLIHAEWDKDYTAHHVLPVYYWNSDTDTFLSPLAAQWHNEEGAKTTFVVPALSWLRTDDDRKDLWLLGPLARFGWDEDGQQQQHVFPFYCLDTRSRTFLSPVYASWGHDDARQRLYPPLLSLYSRDGDRKDLWAALGLFHNGWGDPKRPNEGHLLPLYAYTGGESFYTPFFGWNNERRGYVYGPTPLFGIRTGKQRTGWWLWPLWSQEHETESGNINNSFLWGEYTRRGSYSESYIFPLYWYENLGPIDSEPAPGTQYATYGTDFLCLPLFWYTNRSSVWTDEDNSLVRTFKKRNGLFPLWSHRKDHSRDESFVDQETSILWWLFDYTRDVRPARPGKDEEAVDYTRARVLYRFWHYEKLNGDVSVDVFPAITYDTKKNGFKQTSFLWRFFRYASGPDEGTKLDLFFIPVVRSKPAE